MGRFWEKQLNGSFQVPAIVGFSLAACVHDSTFVVWAAGKSGSVPLSRTETGSRTVHLKDTVRCFEVKKYFTEGN